jgi:hypothetical protein
LNSKHMEHTSDKDPHGNFHNHIIQIAEKVNREDPKVIWVSFKIYNVSNIDSKKCLFLINIKIFYHWIDENLIGHKKGFLKRDEDTGEYPVPGVFDPGIIIMNGFRLSESERQFQVVNSETGQVKLGIRYRGQARILNMDLRYFPFDAQNLHIVLRPERLDRTMVKMRYLQEESTMDAHTNSEFKIFGFTARRYETDPETSSTHKIYSSLHIVILVQRESGWFVNNVMFSSFILAIVCWATFGMHHGQMELTTLALLAIIANKFVCGNLTVKVPYRTLLDMYVDASFLTQIVTIICNVIRENYPIESKNKLQNWETIMLLFQIVWFGIFHIWLCLKLLKYNQHIQLWKAAAHNISVPFHTHLLTDFSGIFPNYSKKQKEMVRSHAEDTVNVIDGVKNDNILLEHQIGSHYLDRQRTVSQFETRIINKNEKEKRVITGNSLKGSNKLLCHQHSYTGDDSNPLEGSNRASLRMVYSFSGVDD